ncbi:hypothetical protein BH10BAC5_BH10BAC5_04370 [soil metagenome]
MKKNLIILLFIFLLSSNYSAAQKLYEGKDPLAYTKGKRLTLTSSTNPLYPSDLLSLEISDTSNYEFKFNVYSDYRQWKFTPKLMLGAYAKVGFEYAKLRHDQSFPGVTPSINLNRTTDLTAQLYGAANYYFMPDKFYVTGAFGLGYENASSHSIFGLTNTTSDSSVVPSYVWGALGYGRINNRQVVEVSYDFSEALMKKGIITSKLDYNTLLKISKLLYSQRDGEYRDKFEDDEMIELFGQVEYELLTAGYIEGKLDARSTIRLYEILNNTSKKFVFYPKYSGYQVQGQVQFQVANESKDKPHQHFLSLSGIHCLNLDQKTNFVFSGFFAIPLDTMANYLSPVSGFGGAFQNYLAFLPDRNNLDFFKTYPPYAGTGNYGGVYAVGLTTVIGVRADMYRTLSSVSGIQAYIALSNFKFKYTSNFLQYDIAARFDYNIYSSLTTYVKMGLLREADLFLQKSASFTTNIGVSYRIF